jgi:hypothetical protein
MFDALKDQAISQATFAASLEGCTTDGTYESNEGFLVAQIAATNQLEENYIAFLRSLSNSVGQGNESECVCDCDDDIVLSDFAGTGVIITPMGNCVYRFYQPTPFDAGGGLFINRMSFRDDLGRCLHIEQTGNPLYPTAAVGYFTEIHDCDNVYDDFPGGFDGGDLIDVKWWLGAPVNETFYKITLAV